VSSIRFVREESEREGKGDIEGGKREGKEEGKGDIGEKGTL
jgi:hypothetical protein